MAATGVDLGTIRTKVPSRLDRLPWSRFHWRVVIGLGTVWILDGLEVTIVGSIAARMTEDGSGIGLSPADIGTAAAIYVTGACLGALFFGQLTDRFGRKKLFLLTLGVYLVATVATAFAFSPLYFFVCRFFTGAGIGGEYAAINSAIDELIPARNRGQVDITINGSYWVGSAIGAVTALLFLNTSIFALDVGWRLSFAMGGILGLAILFVRRHVPESPRWLFIHGREDEAETIVDSIESEVRDEVEGELDEPGDEIEVRQRRTIPFREIAKVAFKLYPHRAILGLALFVGQAFLYNAVTFDLGTILSGFFDVASGSVPFFMAIFALGNFAGPLLLGRLFDTVGRKPMIAGTYFAAAALTAALAVMIMGEGLSEWGFIALVGVTFFFASAGASSAYLTVSEVFPMETRALAIAFFYAVGTAIGGITGPLLFGQLIDSGDADLVAIGFFTGAAVMAVGGLAELVFGVRAEQSALEDIAKPLTVRDAEREAPEEEAPGEAAEAPSPRERVAALAAGHEAEAELHERWSRMHAARAEASRARARGDEAEAERHERDAETQRELAVAAEKRVQAAEHRAAAESLEPEEGAGEEREKAAAREREADERERRVRERLARRLERERRGMRRFRPGPGSSIYAPRMVGSPRSPYADLDLDREIDAIAHALDEHGAMSREELARAVGARYWGPGRFRAALREAVEEGRARRLSRSTFAPPERQAAQIER